MAKLLQEKINGLRNSIKHTEKESKKLIEMEIKALEKLLNNQYKIM